MPFGTKDRGRQAQLLKGPRRRRRLWLFVLGFMATAATGTSAAGSTGLHVDPGSLGTALTELATQSGVNLLFVPSDIGDRRTSGVKGRITVEAALKRLLAGSGLAFRRSAGGAYLIYRVPNAPIAQQAMPDIVVTGRRTQDADIRRTENDIQPYRVANATEIASAHSDNAGEFLRTRLPANGVLSSPAQNPANENGSNRSQIDLHGIGPDQTLVLVDGLRLPRLPSSTALMQPDINALPVGEIDRIETLTATAGGIYGPGATGGVVNIVLRRDYRGADLTLDTSLTQGGGGVRHRIEARLGFTPDGGATDVMMVVGHQTESSLTAGGRTLTERANAKAIGNSPLLYFGTKPTSNAIIVSGTGLSLTSAYGGGSLGADVTYLPIGGSGDPAAVAAQLRANAGMLPATLSADASGRGSSLLSGSASTAVLASIRHRFAPTVEGFVDLIVLEDDGHAMIPGLIQGAILPASAINNPFNQSVNITLPLPNTALVVTNRIRTTRATAGFLIGLPHGWKADVSFGIGGARNELDKNGSTYDLFSLIYGLTSVGAQSPFGNWQRFLSAIEAVRVPEYRHTRLESNLSDANLRLAGPIARLPGGDLTATMLFERRREAKPQTDSYGVDSFDARIPPQIVLPSILERTSSVYAEARAPLIPFDSNAGPMRGLELQAAIRFDRTRIDTPSFFDPLTGNGDRVTLRSDTVSYTAGLRVFPVRPIMLRASIATGDRPPTASEIGTSRTILSIQDPERNNRYSAPEVLRGGSVRLMPALARTLSVGIVVNPNASRRPRLSVDYVRLDLRREVSSLSAIGNEDITYFMAHAAAYPGRIVRAPLTDDDRALGLTMGAIQQIDATALNIGQSRVQAVDFNADWTVRVARGGLRLSAAATWQPELRNTAGLGARGIEMVGYSDGPLEWRANGGAEWSGGGTSVGINGQFYSGYRVQDTAQNVLYYVSTLQGSDRIPAQFYLDLNASYRLRLPGLLKPVLLRVGVTNLLNHLPPVVISDFGGAGYSLYGDPRLRRLSVSITSHF